jgi:hypothetical protein
MGHIHRRCLEHASTLGMSALPPLHPLLEQSLKQIYKQSLIYLTAVLQPLRHRCAIRPDYGIPRTERLPSQQHHVRRVCAVHFDSTASTNSYQSRIPQNLLFASTGTQEGQGAAIKEEMSLGALFCTTRSNIGESAMSITTEGCKRVSRDVALLAIGGRFAHPIKTEV